MGVGHKTDMSPQHKIIKNYLPFAERLLENIISNYSLKLCKHDISAMGEWYVYFENTEFIVGIGQDRSGHADIELGSKLRRKPRAHMRGPWSMSHLRGFIDGCRDHYMFTTLDEEASWFENNDKLLFDSSFLNSDELNKWAVKASRRLFGQK